jgi:hypothetical protein
MRTHFFLSKPGGIAGLWSALEKEKLKLCAATNYLISEDRRGSWSIGGGFRLFAVSVLRDSENRELDLRYHMRIKGYHQYGIETMSKSSR